MLLEKQNKLGEEKEQLESRYYLSNEEVKQEKRKLEDQLDEIRNKLDGMRITIGKTEEEINQLQHRFSQIE